jgi:hypothetical protein
VGIGIWFIEMIIGVITLPLAALASSLVESPEYRTEIPEVELKREIARPRRPRKIIAGGILLIITGAIALLMATGIITMIAPIPSLAELGISGLIIIAALFPLVSGIFALVRRKWGLALAGSVSAIFWVWPLGIPAIILISIGKRDFL